MKSILSKEFVYVNSASTNVAATFIRIRKELEQRTQRKQEIAQEQVRVLRQLPSKAKA